MCIRTLAVMSVFIFDTSTVNTPFEAIIMSAIFTSAWADGLYILGAMTYLMMVFGASTRLEKIRFCLGWVCDIYISNLEFRHWSIDSFYRQQFPRRKGPIVQINSDNSIAFVKQIGELYESICEIVDDINDIFSIHVREPIIFLLWLFL